MENGLKTLNEISKSICKLIKTETSIGSGLTSQSILNTLRTLNSVCIFLLYKKYTHSDLNYSYDTFHNNALPYAKQNQIKFKELLDFYNLLEISSSHYYSNESASETLLKHYLNYLFYIKKIILKELNITILDNLSELYFEPDTQFNEFYNKIAQTIKNFSAKSINYKNLNRYYVLNQKRFYYDSNFYYEITLCPALLHDSKYNRIIVYSDRLINTNYAIRAWISEDFASILNEKIPIKILLNYEIAIRECEFKNFYRIFGKKYSGEIIKTKEYQSLMNFMKTYSRNLLDIVISNDATYNKIKNNLCKEGIATHIFDILYESRNIIYNNLNGHNVLRYLLSVMNNRIIKNQLNKSSNNNLSHLYLQNGCIPFDNMPYALSLIQHPVGIDELYKVISPENRTHELLAAKIRYNTENDNKIYTSISELSEFKNIDNLINIYNSKLYYKHKPYARLEKKENYVFFHGKEADTIEILKILKNLSKKGIPAYQSSINEKLGTLIHSDSEEKINILKKLFDKSSIGILSGPAGTGKTTFIKLLSDAYQNSKILYLAQTNSAKDNLITRVNNSLGEYSTIKSYKNNSDQYSIVVIDECSTIPNDVMINLLKFLNNRYKALLLVGDEYQIESINFGNWFRIAKKVIFNCSYELEEYRRTKNKMLLDIWKACRKGSNDLLARLTGANVTSNFDNSIFCKNNEEEIILCLNYGGLYGVNNLNRFLQMKNKNKSINYKDWTYKIGDPIIFNDSKRFHPVLYNNLKGTILDIKEDDTKITFKIKVFKVIDGFADIPDDLILENKLIDGKSIVKFSVYKFNNYEADEDEISKNTIVPFQVSYAVSMHKAQGLEYNFVKVIISDEIEENISPNIFYTAITRACSNLTIYWSKNTALKIISKIHSSFNNNDDINAFLKFNGKELFKKDF